MKTPEQVAIEEAYAPEEVIAEDTPAQLPVSSQDAGDYIKSRIAEILGEDRANAYKFDVELNRLVDWAKTQGGDSPEEIFWNIRELAVKLGSPELGDNKIKFLHRYVFLLDQENSARKERQKMEVLGET